MYVYRSSPGRTATFAVHGDTRPSSRYYPRALGKLVSHETVKSVQLRAGSDLRRTLYTLLIQPHLLKRSAALTIRRECINSRARFPNFALR